MHPLAAFRPFAVRVATDDVDLTFEGVANRFTLDGLACKVFIAARQTSDASM